MKKFISGIIVGVMLFAGTTVLADGVGLIGKKVTGIYTVEVDGKKIADAAVIGGSTYAPVRSIADATGTVLKVEGKKIIMETESAANTSTSAKIEELKFQISVMTTNIKEKQGSVKLYETDIIPKAEQEYKNAAGTDEEQWKKSSLDSRVSELKNYKTELSELESELEKLESQLAELSK